LWARGPVLSVALGVTSVPVTVSLVLPEARMPETTAQPEVLETTDDAVDDAAAPAEEALVEESLVEEVSIDGMCGVY
jgi:mycofactocin precursor